MKRIGLQGPALRDETYRGVRELLMSTVPWYITMAAGRLGLEPTSTDSSERCDWTLKVGSIVEWCRVANSHSQAPVRDVRYEWLIDPDYCLAPAPLAPVSPLSAALQKVSLSNESPLSALSGIDDDFWTPL